MDEPNTPACDISTNSVLQSVTRVTVVREGRESSEYWADRWEMSVQDDGRTIKLFARGFGRSAERERATKLGADLHTIGDELLKIARYGEARLEET